jgi:hypothetical protein
VIALLAQIALPSSTPIGCPRPSIAAQTLHAQPPRLPEQARIVGIEGDVQVIVTLDENSRVARAAIQSTRRSFSTKLRLKPFATAVRYAVADENALYRDALANAEGLAAATARA